MEDSDGFYKSFRHPGTGDHGASAGSNTEPSRRAADEQAHHRHLVCPASVGVYLEACRTYSTDPNAGSLVFLRFQTHVLAPTAPFKCKDMLALAEALLLHTDVCARIVCADFSEARLGSSGAAALGSVLPAMQRLETLILKGNAIGGYGAQALAPALAQCACLSHLDLQRCALGAVGVASLAIELLETSLEGIEDPEVKVPQREMRSRGRAKSPAPRLRRGGEGGRGLRFMDLSLNAAGLRGTLRVKGALVRRAEMVLVRMDGNIVWAEVMSCVTHAVGFLMSVAGAEAVRQRVREQSAAIRLPALVYSLCLSALYLASSCYHSAFQAYRIKRVLHVVDQSCIYLLIAGTFTPFLAITLRDEPLYSTGMLALLWLMCGIGLCLSFLYFGPWRMHGNLACFLLLGWSGALCLPALSAHMSRAGLWWLAGGGVLYTLGVPFFAMDSDPTTSFLHVVWHLFVMAGSSAHWWAVYAHVLA